MADCPLCPLEKKSISVGFPKPDPSVHPQTLKGHTRSQGSGSLTLAPPSVGPPRAQLFQSQEVTLGVQFGARFICDLFCFMSL